MKPWDMVMLLMGFSASKMSSPWKMWNLGMQKNWGSCLWGIFNETKHVYGWNEFAICGGARDVICREIDATGMEMPSASVWSSTIWSYDLPWSKLGHCVFMRESPQSIQSARRISRWENPYPNRLWWWRWLWWCPTSWECRLLQAGWLFFKDYI